MELFNVLCCRMKMELYPDLCVAVVDGEEDAPRSCVALEMNFEVRSCCTLRWQ